MADFSLNDEVLFTFVHPPKSPTMKVAIKGTVIAINRDKSSKDIKGYALSVHPEDVPEQVRSLKLKFFTEPVSNDDLTSAKNNGCEILSNMLSLVGTNARWVRADKIEKLLKTEDDDLKEKRKQIKFFFKDLEEPWVPPEGAWAKYI